MTSSDSFRDPFVKIYRNARFGDDDADDSNTEDQGIAPAEVSMLTTDQRSNELHICNDTIRDIDSCRSRHPVQIKCEDKQVHTQKFLKNILSKIGCGTSIRTLKTIK